MEDLIKEFGKLSHSSRLKTMAMFMQKNNDLLTSKEGDVENTN